MVIKLNKQKPKEKITKKIFLYISSLLLFNFLLVSLIGNAFLEKYTIKNKADYLYDIYFDLLKISINSNEFNDKIKSILYENIYIIVYDYSTNNVIYSNVNNQNVAINKYDTELLIEEINNRKPADFIITYPTSNHETTIYKITGRQQQITIFGRYLSQTSNKYLIIQTPYQPIIDISNIISRFNIISSLIVLLISIIPTLGFTYFITKPIKEATLVARNIKNKDFSKRCIIRTNDEISEMEEAINIMADSINTYTKELESANDLLKNDINNRKKIEQAQKDFISNVSHEIKTPISIISGYTEGLKQDIASTKEEKEEFCNIILDECERMTSIVVELLSLSKLEDGTTKLEYSDFNINELCDLVVSKFKLKCQKSKINLNLNANKEFIVRADYNEIEKILINYLQNAYKHVSSFGTISIIIKEEGEYVYIGVNNDGLQIPEEEIPNIWNKFYKIDKSHKREENSTGLGLSIVKASMLLHKMPYGVKNTDNGVEFFIKLQKQK